jgi:PPOX class probable F420-dependent enzyme
MVNLPDDVRELFEGANTAHLATLLPDGSPHSVPMWAGVEDGQVVFLTGPGSRKARNLDRDPRMSISIAAKDNPGRMAIVRGRATQLDGARAWEIIDRLAHKYIGQPYPLRTDRVIYFVAATHAQALSFG